MPPLPVLKWGARHAIKCEVGIKLGNTFDDPYGTFISGHECVTRMICYGTVSWSDPINIRSFALKNCGPSRAFLFSLVIVDCKELY